MSLIQSAYSSAVFTAGSALHLTLLSGATRWETLKEPLEPTGLYAIRKYSFTTCWLCSHSWESGKERGEEERTRKEEISKQEAEM